MHKLTFNPARIASYNPAKALSNASILVAATIITVSSYATTYIIEPNNSNARFEIDHFKTSTNSGGFYNLTGQVEYDPRANIGAVSMVIPINSINTGNVAFDNVLKSEDFFEVEKYPLITFNSTKWHFADNKPESPVTKIDGDLSMHGQTHPVTLTATKFNCYFSFIAKKKVCGGDFTTTIDRRKWDISKYTLLGITENVTLNIQVEAAKQ